MIERFSDENGRRRLVDCLMRQQIIFGHYELAVSISNITVLSQFEAGDFLIKQGDIDTDLLFIISGRVSIEVNGREVAIRNSGQHVGEMALIDPSARRAASVVALETTIVASVKEHDFSSLAENNSFLWRKIAIELCDRLRQRNSLVHPVNPRPVVFIGSSRESLLIANQLCMGLKHDDIIVRLWSDGGVFGASRFPIEDLATQVNTSDFAILILGPDDRVISRGKETDSPRDNVVFELGLFMGALSRKRTFIVLPNGLDIKIPSDLLGLTPLNYQSDSLEEDSSVLGPVCEQLKHIILESGPK